MSATTNYKVHILPEVYDKIMWWVDRSPVEISGFGKVQFIDGIPTVTSAYLVEQENTSSDTEIDDTALSKLMYEKREDAGHMNFWWHSHVNMQVFWSATDHEAIEQIGKNGWCLATVFNKKAEQRTAIYQGGSDFFPPIWVDDLDLEITARLNTALVDELEAEYIAKCKAKTYGYSKWKDGTKWCYEKQTWVLASEAKSYADVHGSNFIANDLREDAHLGKQLSLIPTTSGANITTTTGGEADLPTRYHDSDGYLEVMQLDESKQRLVARYYSELYSEIPEDWWDLEEFYQWHYDNLKDELGLPTRKGRAQ